MSSTKTFRNAAFTRRNYECTNLVACVAEVAPGPNWVECDPEALIGLTKFYCQGGVLFYGYM
jgi:hypothetical protein